MIAARIATEATLAPAARQRAISYIVDEVTVAAAGDLGGSAAVQGGLSTQELIIMASGGMWCSG